MAAWKAPTIKSKIFLSTEDCVFLSSREYYRGVQRVVGNLIDRVKGLRTRDCLFIENQIMSELPYTDKMHPLRFAFQLLLAEKHFAKHFEQPEKELACKARMQRFFKQHSHFQSKFPGQSPLQHALCCCVTIALCRRGPPFAAAQSPQGHRQGGHGGVLCGDDPIH